MDDLIAYNKDTTVKVTVPESLKEPAVTVSVSVYVPLGVPSGTRIVTKAEPQPFTISTGSGAARQDEPTGPPEQPSFTIPE